MKHSGGSDLLVAARCALLDALEALQEHRKSVILIGAQAIYLHTGSITLALAEMTKDCDLALDSRGLATHPLIEDAMRGAGFQLDARANQPGAWISRNGIPVDLMVPEALSGGSGRRGARIPPHANSAARRAVGLEAAVVDHNQVEFRALDPNDDRALTANVAGPAASLVAKTHKIAERLASPGRLVDKDAHDIYRVLVAVPTDRIARTFQQLRSHELAGPVTEQAIRHLAKLFAAGPTAPGAKMAGRAEEGVGEPEIVAASVSALAQDLLAMVSELAISSDFAQCAKLPT